MQPAAADDTGTLPPCLFTDREIALRGAAPADLHAKFTEAAQAKPEHHPLGDDFAILAGTMAEIGGQRWVPRPPR